MHIAIVDDEDSILEVLSDAFEDEGYRTSTLNTGSELLQLMLSDAPDLILLDLKLKAENGLRVAEQIRKHSEVPIIMLTGKGDETDRILGLEVAADDYIMKPFNIRELIARVRAQLRRSTFKRSPVKQEDTQKLYFQNWCLDIDLRTLTGKDGQQVALTFGEFSLLSVLLSSPNRVFSRNELLDKTHGTLTESFDRTIDVLILRLRRKIEDNPKLPEIILTERGIGYRLASNVIRS
ncbi:MAG: response regulator transcription factor [Reinekea sp.]|jgi:two-component system, OmpR family, response regulator